MHYPVSRDSQTILLGFFGSQTIDRNREPERLRGRYRFGKIQQGVIGLYVNTAFF